VVVVVVLEVETLVETCGLGGLAVLEVVELVAEMVALLPWEQQILAVAVAVGHKQWIVVVELLTLTMVKTAVQVL